jgi:hypothetical protein
MMAANIAKIGIQFAMMPIIAHLLGLAPYGLFVLAFAGNHLHADGGGRGFGQLPGVRTAGGA